MALRGDRIKELREARGLSVRQLAQATRIRHPTIYDIEAGKPINIGVDALVRLARFFGVEPGYLLDMREEDSRDAEIEPAVAL